MKKKRTMYPHSVKDIKGKVAIAELKRAHLIIVVLALCLAFVVVLAAAGLFVIDMVLASLLAGLLAIVALFSLLTILYIK